MRKLLFFFIALCSLLQSCTIMKDVTKTYRMATYDISLSQVESPSNQKDQYSETISKIEGENGISKYSFEDDNIHIIWYAGLEEFYFTILNKTNHALKINWNEAVYVDIDKKAGKVIHSGVKYAQKNEAQVPSLIPKGSRLEDVVVPADNIYYSSYLTSWETKQLFPTSFSSDEELNTAQKYEGKEMSVLLPITIENVQNDYLFTFKVDKVRTTSKTETTQVHDTDAEFAAAMWIVLGGIIAGLTIPLLLIL